MTRSVHGVGALSSMRRAAVGHSNLPPCPRKCPFPRVALLEGYHEWWWSDERLALRVRTHLAHLPQVPAGAASVAHLDAGAGHVEARVGVLSMESLRDWSAAMRRGWGSPTVSSPVLQQLLGRILFLLGSEVWNLRVVLCVGASTTVGKRIPVPLSSPLPAVRPLLGPMRRGVRRGERGGAPPPRRRRDV